MPRGLNDQKDTDKDSIGDACDNDDFFDVPEVYFHTNPLDPDSDEDGISDGDEFRHITIPSIGDPPVDQCNRLACDAAIAGEA